MTELRKPQEVDILLFAVVQSQDAERAENALTKIGQEVTRLPSTGGFLGRRNATLLIGTNENKWEEVTNTLRENCRQRVEFIAVPLESTPLPLPAPIPVTVGGASIFSLEVEHFEEI